MLSLAGTLVNTTWKWCPRDRGSYEKLDPGEYNTADWGRALGNADNKL